MRSRVFIYRKETRYNEEKGTTVCILHCGLQPVRFDVGIRGLNKILDKVPLLKASKNGDFVVTGITKCRENDTFDKVKGARIAESKAKAKMFRTTYLFYKEMQRKLELAAEKAKKYKDINEYLTSKELEHVKELSKS